MTIGIGDFINRTPSLFGALSGVRLGKVVLPVVAVVALGGCSIHPIQQDVTHLKTVEVVDHIRCETQRAIQDKAIDLLINLDGEGSPAAKLGVYLRDNRDKFRKFPRAMLPSDREKKFYDRYINTAIAMEFSFDITESGGAGFTADAIRLISGGTAGVVVSGSDAVSRNNIRRFLIAETFGELLDLDEKKLDCRNPSSLPNFQYPIAGNIGMGELISTFIDLNQEKDLSPTSKDGPEVFGDTLKFTTTLSGAITPHVILAPVGNRWGVDPPTNIGLSAGRVDNHQLTIGLSIGKPPTRVGTIARAAFVAQTTLRQTGNNNKNQAIQAIENQHVKNFFDRTTFLR
jgi:hypothetical protein